MPYPWLERAGMSTASYPGDQVAFDLTWCYIPNHNAKVQDSLIIDVGLKFRG